MILTSSLFENVRAVICHWDLNFDPAMDDVDPDDGLPVTSTYETLRINRETMREVTPSTTVAIVSAGSAVAIIMGASGDIITHPIPSSALIQCANRICSRIGGLRWTPRTVILGSLPPLCNSDQRLERVMSYGCCDDDASSRYVGVAPVDVMTAVTE